MRLFISFAREDLARVRELAEILEEAGHQAWFDDKLVPGLRWEDQLLEEIRQSEIFVYALSPASVASEWCQREFWEAGRLRKPVLPILLDAGTQLPESLAPFQYADFTRGATPRDTARLIGGITRLLAHPTHLPEPPAEPQGVPTRALDLDLELPLLEPEQEPEVLPETPSEGVSSEEVHALLAEAYKIRDSDPERALFLFYQLRKIDPEFMGPTTPSFIAQQETRLKPIRLANMRKQAEALIEAEEWAEAERVAQAMMALKPDFATTLLRSILDYWIEALLVARDWEEAEAVGLRRQELGGRGSKTQLLRVRQTAALALAQDSAWEQALELAQRAADIASAKGAEIRNQVLRLWGEAAMTQGDWVQAEQVGQRMIELKGNVAEARQLIADASTNAQYERQYRQAAAFWKGGQDSVAIDLLRDLKAACPTYGDPEGLLSGRPIDPEFAPWIRRQRTIRAETDLGEVEVAGPAKELIEQPLYSPDLAFCPNRNLWATAYDKIIALERMEAGETIGQLKGHKGTVRCLEFNRDGSLLASSASSKSVWIWDTEAQTRVDLVNGRSGDWFSVLAFSPGDNFLAAAGYHGIAVWQRPKKSVVFSPNPRYLPVQQATVLAFSPDGRLLVSGERGGRIAFWDLRSSKPVVSLLAHDAEIVKVAFSPDGKLLVSAAKDDTVTLWGMGNLDGPR